MPIQATSNMLPWGWVHGQFGELWLSMQFPDWRKNKRKKIISWIANIIVTNTVDKLEIAVPLGIY